MDKAVGELESWHAMLPVFEISARPAPASTDIVSLLSSSPVLPGFLLVSCYGVIIW